MKAELRAGRQTRRRRGSGAGEEALPFVLAKPDHTGAAGQGKRPLDQVAVGGEQGERFVYFELR